MSFFYDLNKKLNSIRAEDKQINEDVAKAKAKAEVKSPARQTLEESLAYDLKALMEGAPAKADKDYDGDGKIESPKDEVWGSRLKAAKKAGKLKETDRQKEWQKRYDAMMKTPHGRAAIAAAEKDPDPHSINKAVEKHYAKVKEDGTGGMNFSGSGSLEEKTGYSAKKARAGKDIGKPGKNFSKIAKSAGEKYGSEEAGKQVAGAVLAKLRAAKESVQEADHELSADKIDAASKKSFKGIKKVVMKNRHDKELEEAGLPDIVDKKAKMDIARGKKPSSMRNVVKGLKAFVKGTAEPMDETDLASAMEDGGGDLAAEGRSYPNPSVIPHDERFQPQHFEEDDDMIGYLKKKAFPVNYNKGSGKPDAHNGMEFEAWGGGESIEPMEEAVSRKHFQQVADLLQNIPDPEKRKELAMHHASIFKQQNPRFDIKRFGDACGVDLAECAMWEDLKGGQHKLDIDGDGDIGADDLAALRAGKKKETDEGWDDAMALGRAAANQKPGLSRHDVRDTGYSRVYTRKPDTYDADTDSDDDAPAVKRGRGRPTVAKAPERVTKGAWKRKEVDERGGLSYVGKDQHWQSYKGGAKPWNAESAELDEKSVSQAQAHMMAGAAHDPAFAKKVGISPKVAKEFNKADKGVKISKLPKHVEEEEVNEKAEAGKRKFFDKLAPAAKKVAKVVNKITKDKDVEESKPAKKVKAEEDHGATIPEVGLTVVNAKGQEMKKKVKETTTAGSVATVAAGSTTESYGKGVYESFDSKVEKLIAESFTVNMSKTITDNGQNQSNINISATDEDADMLKDLLKNAGIDIHGGQSSNVCPGCGHSPCDCDSEVEVDPVADGFAIALTPSSDDIEFELDEADVKVDQNSPDYPTNQEYSDDALQYAGGLNKPKSTGQTTIPVIASQLNRQMSESSETDSFLNLYKAFKTK